MEELGRNPQRRDRRTTGMEETDEAKMVEREEDHGNYLMEMEKGEKEQSRSRAIRIMGSLLPCTATDPKLLVYRNKSI